MATVPGTKRLLDISGNNISTALSLTASGTLLDANGAAGASGQVLSSIGSGVDWVDASSVIGGPYLPLTAGSSYPLTGTLYLGNVGGDQKIQFQRTGGNVYSIEHDSAQLYFYNRTTTESPLVIQNDGDVLMNAGNVGIGTTSPTADLHVQGSSATDIPIIRSGGFGNSGSKLELAETLTSGAMNYGFSFFNDGNSSNTLMIKAHNNSTTGVTAITINRTNSQTTFSTVPVVGTRTAGDNSTYAASTAFVTAAVAAAPQGTVTSVTATAPILSSGGTSPAISARVPATGDWWNGGLAQVATDGVMEIGKYIDMHATDAATSDFDVRLTASTGSLNVSGDIVIGGGDITLNGTGRIQGVDTVSAGTDAANKAYVDASVPSVGNGTFTVTGNTGLSGTGSMTANQSGNSSATLTNTDRGSSQNIYKNFTASSGGTATANSNNDTLTIAAGTNVTTVRSGDTITINATNDGQGVTSVNFKTDGTALNVASNTITGSGTMTGIWQGTSSEYVNGLGDRVAFPSIPQGDITAVIAGTGLTGGGTSGSVTLNVAGGTYTPYNDIRSLGVQAFTNGANPNITTAQVMAEIESDGGFDSYSSVFKTSWSYAGNYNLTDAGDFTETAGSSWITWTDNSSDTTRGNITALAIAPTTGSSAGGVFIYNDQGSSYSPGWRQVWTSTTDGAGSGLDADLLDGQQGSYYLDYANFTGTPTIPSVGNGQIDGRTSGLGLSGSMDATANQSGNTTFTVTSNAVTAATANTIAYRTSSADIRARLFRSNYANQTTISGGMAFRVNNGADDYIRFCTDKAAIRTFLGVPASGDLNSYLLNTTDTFTGALTINGDIRGNGQQLILNAGEAYNYATGQSNEYVYINAEQGLEVNSSPDNWSSGWAGRNTTTIGKANGTSSFPGQISVQGSNVIEIDQGYSYLNHLKLLSTFGSKLFSATNYGYVLESSSTPADPVTFRFDNDRYRIYSGTSGEALTVLANGRVGIGMTSPNAQLNVNGSIKIESTNGLYFGGSGSVPAWGINSSGNDLIIDDQATTSGDVLFNNNGNVGIGTISPGSKLHVSGGDIELDDGQEVKFDVSGRVTASEELVLDAGNTDSKIILEGSDSAMQFITGNSTAIAINDAQNVGIGTTSPANKLDVVGISRFTHSSSTSYRGAIETVTDNAYPTWDIGWLHARTTSSTYGNIARFNNQTGTQIGGIFYSGSSGTSFVTTSDYRLKENIKEIRDSISRVKKLKPCRFNFAAEKNRIIDGFIAHEVQEVVPEAVHGEKDALQKDGSIDAQTLEVSRLIPVLTKALQEAINKIEELELRIQTIENN